MEKPVLLAVFILLLGCTTKVEYHTEALGPTAIDGRKEVVCFLYHRFGDSRYPSTNISLADFEEHLRYLKTNDFTVLTFSAAIDYLRSDQPLKKVATLTIDDGFQSFYENAAPLLKKYDFPATLFINTQTIDGGDYMGWKEIKEVHDQGIEIGNHTHSHAYFLNHPETERYKVFEAEVKQTQKLIKDNIGQAPETFAYPYGELDLKMKAIIKNFGFKAAAAQNSGVIYNGTDLMQCPRFPMSESYAALDRFSMKAETKALRVNSKIPESFILPEGENTPVLTLNFALAGLRVEQLQCFIQGSACTIHRVLNEDSTVTLTLTPKSPISTRRRTLYTVTVPNDEGKWHWFSHLWINPDVD
ncbi:MAG: polysaccharide deacetylase family protein [Bacteroidota bacterium]